MVKLIACAIPVVIFIFGDPVIGVISLFIPFFIFFFSWIIKSNKQQPGESDEDYAKRMEVLHTVAQSRPDLTDPLYSNLPCNKYHFSSAYEIFKNRYKL